MEHDSNQSGLQEFEPGSIWLKAAPLRFWGLKFDTRMTIVRLIGGGLFIHSPIRLDDKTKAEIDALGPVRFVVLPNKLHHVFMADWGSAYPESKIYASPGLSEKRKDLKFHGTLGDAPEPDWHHDLDQTLWHGNRFMQEVVFLHRKSKTLIVADLIENFHEDTPPITRLFARVFAMYKNPAPSPEHRLMAWDRTTVRRSLEKVLGWEFDRIILAHGRLIPSGGKQVLEKAYAWL